MITPSKHLNLDLCVLKAGAVVLSALKRFRVLQLDELRQKVVSKLGPDGELLFTPTIHFLFLVGRLDYHPESDTFEYIELKSGRSADGGLA